MLQIMRVLRAIQHKLGPETRKNRRILRKRTAVPEPTREAQQVTNCRLHKLWVCMPSAEACPETAWLAHVRRSWLPTGRMVGPPLLWPGEWRRAKSTICRFHAKAQSTPSPPSEEEPFSP